MNIVKPKLIYECSTFIVVIIENKESWDSYNLEKIFNFSYQSVWDSEGDDDNPHVLIYGIPLLGIDDDGLRVYTNHTVYKYDRHLWTFMNFDTEEYHRFIDRINLDCDFMHWVLNERCGHDLIVQNFLDNMSIAFSREGLSSLSYGLEFRGLFGKAIDIDIFVKDVLKHFISLSMRDKNHIALKVAYFYMYNYMRESIKRTYGVEKYAIKDEVSVGFVYIKDIMWKYYKDSIIVDDFYSINFDKFIDDLAVATLYNDFTSSSRGVSLNKEVFINNFNRCFENDYVGYIVFSGAKLHLSDLFKVNTTGQCVANKCTSVSKRFIACLMNYLFYFLSYDNDVSYIRNENGTVLISDSVPLSSIFVSDKELPSLRMKDAVFEDIKGCLEFLWRIVLRNLDAVKTATSTDCEVKLSEDKTTLLFSMRCNRVV